MSPFLREKYGDKNLVNDNPREWQQRFKTLTNALEDTTELTTAFAAQHQKKLKTFIKQYHEDQAILALPEAERPTNMPNYLLEIEAEGEHQYFMEFTLEEVQIKKSIAILDALDSFAKSAFAYFYDGYYVHKENTLTISRSYPPRYILKTLLDQLAYDLSIVQLAANQRQRRPDGQTTTQGHALLLADQLANLALQPARAGGLLDEKVAILTYLSRNVRVRLVPYANTLLVSLAFASVSEKEKPSRDYLALAHEVGHHLYWNGRIPTTNQLLKDALDDKIAANKNMPNWCKHWVEEIFADTYALIVGGPVIALDFQDMLDDDVPQHFTHDTDKHPIPQVRPLIQTEILRRIKDKQGNLLYKNVPDLLDSLWQEWIGSDVADQSYRPHNAHAALTGQALVKELDPLIDIILDLLADALPADASIPWSKDINGRSQIKDLYHLQIPGNESENKQRMIRYFGDDGTQIKQLPGYLDKLNIDTIVQSVTFEKHRQDIEKQKGRALSSQEWIEHFLTHGWSIEGPMGSTGGH